MSVPGRIGIILIVALALLDGLILMSGARQVADQVETGALVRAANIEPIKSDCLLSTALQKINLITAKPIETPNGT